MSTNFYLHRDPQNCGECSKPRREGAIHIGKRSGGWVFTWQGFDASNAPNGNPLYDANTWRDFLATEVNDGGEIRDEYRTPYSVEQFMEEVLAQRGLRHQSVEYPGHAQKTADGDDVSYGEWS